MLIREQQIQALHGAARYEDTDWTAIVRFHDRQITRMTTPVVALNTAIALAETHGPGTGLALLDGSAEELDGSHLLHARGSLLERLERPREAADTYDRAAARARTDTDISFLKGAWPRAPWRESGRAVRLGISYLSPHIGRSAARPDAMPY